VITIGGKRAQFIACWLIWDNNWRGGAGGKRAQLFSFIMLGDL